MKKKTVLANGVFPGMKLCCICVFFLSQVLVMELVVAVVPLVEVTRVMVDRVKDKQM